MEELFCEILYLYSLSSLSLSRVLLQMLILLCLNSGLGLGNTDLFVPSILQNKQAKKKQKNNI